MKKIIILSALALSFLVVSSCKKSSSSNNNNNNTSTQEDFVTMGGYTFWGKNRTEWKLHLVGGDTGLSYRRVYGIEDTQMFVYHEIRKAKNYNIAGASNADIDCIVQVNWGSDPSSPKVDLDGGTYKLERVNGHWVSTVTNGTGINSTTNQRVNNISLRLTWPD